MVIIQKGVEIFGTAVLENLWGIVQVAETHIEPNSATCGKKPNFSNLLTVFTRVLLLYGEFIKKKMGPQRRHCLVFIKQHSCNSMKHRKNLRGTWLVFGNPNQTEILWGFVQQETGSY